MLKPILARLAKYPRYRHFAYFVALTLDYVIWRSIVLLAKVPYTIFREVRSDIAHNTREAKRIYRLLKEKDHLLDWS